MFSQSSLAQSGLHVNTWGPGSDMSSAVYFLAVCVKTMLKYQRKHMVPVSPPISKTGYPSCSLSLSKEQGITCGFLESSTNSLICEVIEPITSPPILY